MKRRLFLSPQQRPVLPLIFTREEWAHQDMWKVLLLSEVSSSGSTAIHMEVALMWEALMATVHMVTVHMATHMEYPMATITVIATHTPRTATLMAPTVRGGIVNSAYSRVPVWTTLGLGVVVCARRASDKLAHLRNMLRHSHKGA